MDGKRPFSFYKTAYFAFKILIAAAVIGTMVYLNRQNLISVWQKFSAAVLLPALCCALIMYAAGAWRWQRLAAIAGLQLSFREAFSLTMQGNFFSLLIPGGAVGGDLIKIGMVSRRSAAGCKLNGALTILMDRLIGMLALFTLGLAVTGACFPLLMRLPLGFTGNLTVALLFGGTCAAGVLAAAAIFACRSMIKLPLISTLFAFADRKSKGFFSRICASIDLYSGARKTLLVQTLSSLVLIHLMPVAIMAMIFHGFGLKVDLSLLLPAVILSNIAGLIPLFPGGIGGRDVAAVALLTAGGVGEAEATAAQLCTTGITLFFSLLLGGGAFIFDAGKGLSYGKEGSDSNEQ